MNNSTPTIRAFVAVELPGEVQARLSSIQHALQAGMGEAAGAVRWSRPEGTHLTLQFLGDVRADSLPLVESAVVEGCEGMRSMELSLGEIGTFPNLRRPRVVWVGVSGELDLLHRVERSIEGRLKPLGYAPDKPFNPHLTLGRVREGATASEREAIASAIAQTPVRVSAAFRVESVTLMRSQPLSGGSLYTSIVTAPLD